MSTSNEPANTLDGQQSQLHVLNLGDEQEKLFSKSVTPIRVRSHTSHSTQRAIQSKKQHRQEPRTADFNSKSQIQFDQIQSKPPTREKIIHKPIKAHPKSAGSLSIERKPTSNPSELHHISLGESFKSNNQVPLSNQGLPCHSPVFPTGAHSSGYYSKLRQETDKANIIIPTVSSLIQEQVIKISSKPGTAPSSRPFTSTESTRPNITDVIDSKTALPTTAQPNPISLLPLERKIASPKSEVRNALIDNAPSSTNQSKLEDLLVKLTDSDISLENSINILRDLSFLASSNRILLLYKTIIKIIAEHYSKLLLERGIMKILTGMLNNFSNSLEINNYGFELINLISDGINEMTINKNELKIILGAASVVFQNQNHAKDGSHSSLDNLNGASPLKGKSNMISHLKNSFNTMEESSRKKMNGLVISNAVDKKNNRSSNNRRRSKDSSRRISVLLEAEEGDNDDEDDSTMLKTIDSNAESIIEGLLSDYYSPNFITNFEDLGKKGRIEAVKYLLTQFEKVDKLISVTSCTSLDVDLNKALAKILSDTEEMMQAELVLFYEVDFDARELVARHIELSLPEEERHLASRVAFPGSAGIAGFCATTGDMINIKKPIDFPRYHPAIDAAGTNIIPENILAAPIADQDRQVFSVIQIVNKIGFNGEQLPFTSEDEYLLKLLAKTMAIVITNSKSIERMKQTKKKVEVLLETTKSLSSTLDFDTLIKMIMDSAKELLSADRCTLFLKDESRKQLVGKIVIKDAIQEIRIKMDAGIAGSVLMSGQSINIRDAYKDSRFNPEVDKQTGYVTRTILCMPIKNVNGDCIGVTQMINKKAGVFTSEDEMILSSFSAQAAVAIEKTQLFKKTEDMRIYQQSILASITSCVITLSDSMRMVSMNRPWFMNAIQTTEEIMKDQPVNKWLGPDNSILLKDILTVYQTQKPIFSTEYELKGQKSSFINYQVMPLFTNASNMVGVVMVLDDISSEKKAVMTLGRYMSPALAKQVMQDDGGQLGGTRKKVSILFSDIRSFTKLSEALEPHEVVELLNQHFTGAVNAIVEEKGILDKFIGDAVMAVFGVPFATIEDPINSCNAALKMKEAVKNLDQRREAAGLRGIKVGIGINTGMVLSGNIGSPKRMEYSCIGDAVNLASRVEGLTKGYGVTILITEFTLAETNDLFFVREIDSVIVVGKSQAVKLYELVGKKSETIPEGIVKACQIYSEGLALYKKRKFEEAIDKFQKGITLFHDGPCRVMLERCFKYLESPPDKEWTGVYVAEGK